MSPLEQIHLDTDKGLKLIELKKNCKVVLHSCTFGQTVYHHSKYPEYVALSGNYFLPLYNKEEAIEWCKSERDIPPELIVKAFGIDVD